ncbi:UPF0147 family protein [Candidatus Woesearchaeota archaeon]|nr:UPF0147 family protein [Candidatus Woesearchaeota archaeon]
MSKQQQVDEIIEALQELEEDSTVPRNIRAKVAGTIQILQSKDELKLRIDKALQEMEEIASDNNMQSYTRAQIWNIVSMLESL